MAIKGIKSVDFVVTATGEGVVNHNGSFSVYNPAAGQKVDNHLFPKLRGMDPMQRLKALDDGKSMSMRLDDPSFADAKLMVSAECVRAGIFKDVSFGLASVNVGNVASVLSSLHGLIRGYLITDGGRNFARKSPLFCTDFECDNPGLVFNQGTNAKTRGTAAESTSMYSYFKTNSDLEYRGKLSLSVEDLQFIPMENSLGRSAYDHQISVAMGNAIAADVTRFLADLTDELKPEARFVKRVRRIGAVSQRGDAGLLLNDDALRVITSEVRELIESLYIRQGKGFLQVTDVLVDFNDSNRVFRAGRDASTAVDDMGGPFARYYEEVEVTDEDFEKGQTVAQAEREEREGKKKKGSKKVKAEVKTVETAEAAE